MGTLSLTSEVHVFPCPNCRETINTSMQQCPFCHTPISTADAATAAAETSRISQACSDASYLKIMLGVLIPFGLASFVPFLSFIGLLGFVFIKYAIAVMTIRWWIKYANLKTSDPDFSKARGTAILVSAISALVLIIFRVHLYGLHI